MDTLKIQRPHEEYGRAVQAYFHSLFPHRQWSVFQDPDGTPLAVDVELLYPTVEEPFYLLHTIGMKATANSASSCRLIGPSARTGIFP